MPLRLDILCLQQLGAIADGTYGYRYVAWDNANNSSTSGMQDFIVDTTPPRRFIYPIDNAPNNGTKFYGWIILPDND